MALSAWSEGGEGQDVVVKVKREERGSWSRGSVRIDRDGRKLKIGQKGGMLDLAGLEQFPVNWELDSSDEVVELLARPRRAGGDLRAREQRDLEVEQDRLELEQVAALAEAAHDEIVRAGDHGVEDLVGHAVRDL